MPPSPRKRKTLHDYFPSPRGSLSPSPARPPKPVAIPGLSIVPNFVTREEQATLLSFLDAETWRTDLARRTIHYGGTCCIMPPKSASAAEREAISKQIITASAMPDSLGWLTERMTTRGLYAADAPLRLRTVNEYLRSQGISAHVENFRFGEPVCSLTLGCGDFMRFHELSAPHDGSVRSFKAAQAPRTGRRLDVWMPSGSLLVLSADARYRWQHEIVAGKNTRQGDGWRRVSLTFRVEKQRRRV